jgi:hypothetical protein
MKPLSAKLVVIVVAFGLAIFAYTEVWGENWKSFYKNDLFTLFYDIESITHPSMNIVRVQNKRIYSEKGRTEMAKRGSKAYKNINFSIGLLEINCINGMGRLISMSHYAQNGSLIETLENKEKDWVIMDPDAGEVLEKEVCK